MSNNAARASKKDKILAILKELETKGDIKNSLLEMLKTGAIGLVGAGVGAVIGKPSLLVGLGTIVAGHYYKSPRALVLGAGMIASGGYKMATGIQGTPLGGMEGVKERFKAFGADIKDRLYIDKIMKLKSGTDGLKGLGAVQYFDPSQVNMGSLDAIEDEIAKSSMQFDQKQFAGSYEDISGTEDRIL